MSDVKVVERTIEQAFSNGYQRAIQHIEEGRLKGVASRSEQADRRFQAAVAAMRADIERGGATKTSLPYDALHWVACADALLAALDGSTK